MWNDAVFDNRLVISSVSGRALGYLVLYDYSVRTSTAWLAVVGGSDTIGSGAMIFALGAYIEICFRDYPLRSILAEIGPAAQDRLGCGQRLRG